MVAPLTNKMNKQKTLCRVFTQARLRTTSLDNTGTEIGQIVLETFSTIYNQDCFTSDFKYLE